MCSNGQKLSLISSFSKSVGRYCLKFMQRQFLKIVARLLLKIVAMLDMLSSKCRELCARIQSKSKCRELCARIQSK